MIEIQNLRFGYAQTPALQIDQLTIPLGARVLLVGRNGAGKTTLLELLAGRRLINPASIKILGKSAFEDPSLVHDVTYIGPLFAFTSDISVREILAKQSYEQARLDELVEVLGIDLNWSLWRVSNGQRRRIHLLLTLLQPRRLVLMDEATSELDLITRLDLLAYLRKQPGAIVYASHVFDGLEDWPTHILWVKQGHVALFDKQQDIELLKQNREQGHPSPLMKTIEAWLRSDV